MNILYYLKIGFFILFLSCSCSNKLNQNLHNKTPNKYQARGFVSDDGQEKLIVHKQEIVELEQSDGAVTVFIAIIGSTLIINLFLHLISKTKKKKGSTQ
jgi:hypothetical protein